MFLSAEGRIMPRIQMTNDWSFDLEADFRRRIEDGNLIFWRSKQTIWCDIFEHKTNEQEMLAILKEDSNPNPEQIFEELQGDVLKYAYLLSEADGAKKAWELNTFSITSSDYVLMSYYFEGRSMLEWALGCWRSVSYKSNTVST
jgi:hypothetical protein